MSSARPALLFAIAAKSSARPAVLFAITAKSLARPAGLFARPANPSARPADTLARPAKCSARPAVFIAGWFLACYDVKERCAIEFGTKVGQEMGLAEVCLALLHGFSILGASPLTPLQRRGGCGAGFRDKIKLQ